MRILSTIIFLGALGYGLWWVNEKHPEWKTQALQLLHSSDITALEPRLTPEQIIEHYRKTLLSEGHQRLFEPEIKYYPYLLMEVKYALSAEKTGEGVILWDLLDGEMITDATHWEKTHGFSDCINANASKSELQIIQAIAKRGGHVDEETLRRMTALDKNILQTWIGSCRRKKLIVQNGRNYRLHMQNPRLSVLPETIVNGPLTTKTISNAACIAKRYNPRDIRRAASYAFGEDFAIRTTREVYLPIYRMTIQNPDLSLYSAYFNALSGRQIASQSFVE